MKNILLLNMLLIGATMLSSSAYGADLTVCTRRDNEVLKVSPLRPSEVTIHLSFTDNGGEVWTLDKDVTKQFSQPGGNVCDDIAIGLNSDENSDFRPFNVSMSIANPVEGGKAIISTPKFSINSWKAIKNAKILITFRTDNENLSMSQQWKRNNTSTVLSSNPRATVGSFENFYGSWSGLVDKNASSTILYTE
jgi:hypothetical protein